MLFAAVPEPELQGCRPQRYKKKKKKKLVSMNGSGEGSTVCVRAQEGSVKSLCHSSLRPNSPPTWNNSRKNLLCRCQSPVAVFLHKAPAPEIWTGPRGCRGGDGGDTLV